MVHWKNRFRHTVRAVFTVRTVLLLLLSTVAMLALSACTIKQEITISPGTFTVTPEPTSPPDTSASELTSPPDTSAPEPVEKLVDTVTILSATEGIDGHNAENLFDHQTGTKWCVEFHDSAYVEWKTPESVKITCLRFAPADDLPAAYPDRNPSSYTFEIRNSESEEWHTIASMENIPVLDTWIEETSEGSVKRAVIQNYTIYNAPEAQYFRVTFHGTHGAPYLQLAEISLVIE